MKGQIIVIGGEKCTGKTVLAGMLEDSLQRAGRTVAMFPDEPYTCEAVRRIKKAAAVREFVIVVSHERGFLEGKPFGKATWCIIKAVRYQGTHRMRSADDFSGAARGRILAGLARLQPTGVEIIDAERNRQLVAEKFDPKRDDQYVQGELARAAACYAMPPAVRDICVQIVGKPRGMVNSLRQLLWPWHPKCFKAGERVRELAKAGALIAAEIDRLNRSAPSIFLTGGKIKVGLPVDVSGNAAPWHRRSLHVRTCDELAGKFRRGGKRKGHPLERLLYASPECVHFAPRSAAAKRRGGKKK